MKRFVTYTLCTPQKMPIFQRMQRYRAITRTILSGVENMDCIPIGDWKIRYFLQQVKRNFGEMYIQFIANGLDIFSLSCIFRHSG